MVQVAVESDERRELIVLKSTASIFWKFYLELDRSKRASTSIVPVKKILMVRSW